MTARADPLEAGWTPSAQPGHERRLMNEVKMLCAALLWARNHLEVGKPEVRDNVIAALDRVIEGREPSVADMKHFREMYLQKVELK